MNTNYILMILLWFLGVCPAHLSSQIDIYSSKDGSKEVKYLETTLAINDDNADGALPRLGKPTSFGSAAILAIAGPVVDFGLAAAKDIQENRIKKFSNEQVFHTSLVSTTYGAVPIIEVERTVYKQPNTSLYSFNLTPKKVNDQNDLFYYELQDFHLSYAECKVNKAHPRLNFSIEVELKIINSQGKFEILKSSPIIISYCSTTSKDDYIEQNIHSSVFQRNISIIGAAFKVTQTNATKISPNEFSRIIYGSGENLSSLITAIGGNLSNDKDNASVEN